jgi:hypothetical protein
MIRPLIKVIRLALTRDVTVHKQEHNLKSYKVKTVNKRGMLRCLPCSRERLVLIKLQDGCPLRDSCLSSSGS